MGGDALALALVEDRDDDAPAAVEERSRDGGAEAARPSGDERAGRHDPERYRAQIPRSVRAPCHLVRMFVRELQEGAAVQCVLLVREAELRAGRDGGQVLRLVLADRTGSLPATVRDDVAAVAEIATVGAPVHVSGRLAHGAELELRAICRAEPGTYDPADLVDGPPRSAAQMEADLRELLATVRDRDLAGLLHAVFCADSPLWPRYRSAPAAKRFHQAYRHGLLEHSLSVAQAVSAISATFTEINRDVAVTGALLHDIGKLDAYAFAGGAIELTDAGKLHGEIPLGYYRVRVAHRRDRGLRPEHRRGGAAHHPQPPRLARARQPDRALHARGHARALLRQPRRPARLVRPAREGAAQRRALVALRPGDRRRGVLRLRHRWRARRAKPPDRGVAA